MEEEIYTSLVNYFTNEHRRYPEEVYNIVDQKSKSDVKTKFRQKTKPYRVEGNTLYYGKYRVAKDSEVDEILRACHDNPSTGGHFGRDKTMQKITENYYWKGMKKDIMNYVKKCKKCFAVNPKFSKEAPPLNPIPVPERVWALVRIDLIGPLQETERGNKYIVAITDLFSKFSQAAPIPDKSAKSVSLFLYSVICRLGCMEAMISDQGREFVNQIIDDLMEKFQSDHRIASAYHPQTNGQRERDNRTLKDTLRKLVNQNGDDWDLLIDGALFSYHTSVHASIKTTPFEVMYGRKARLPTIASENPEEKYESEKGESDDIRMEDILEIRKDLNAKVGANLDKAKTHQKKHYDNRNKSNKTYDVGTIVYIKNPKQINRKGNRMEPRWIGPYVIHEHLGMGKLKLKNLNSGALLKNVYHGSNCKVYDNSNKTSRETDEEDSFSLTKVDKSVFDFMTKSNGSEQQSEEVSNNSTAKEATSDNPDTDDDVLEIPDSSNFVEKNHFIPLSSHLRKALSKRLSLDMVKCISFGKVNKELPEPKRSYCTKGDGNCYFRAISYVLSGTEDNYALMRKHVVTHMRSVKKEIEGLLNQDVGEYLNQSQMQENGTWATETEILATANLLNCDIHIYTEIQGKNVCKWFKYAASFRNENLCNRNGGIYLKNVGNHFYVVTSV